MKTGPALAIKSRGFAVGRTSSVIVSDAAGRTVRAVKLDGGSYLDMSNLRGGAYVVSVVNDDGATVTTMVVHR